MKFNKKNNHFTQLLLLLITFLLGSNSSTFAQKCFEEVSNGVIAIEAEDFFSQEKTSKREWFVIGDGARTPKPDPDGSHANMASGKKYIEVLPDTRVIGHSGPGPEDPLVRGENFSDKAGELAVLNYKVNFKSAGKYFVWVRLYSTGPEDNSIHVGLNNTWPESGERMQWCVRNKWEWESKQRTKDQHCGVERQIFINVPSAGEHTFQISMREDGVEVDKIVLSKSYNKPSGNGPVAKTGNCPTNSTTENNSNTGNSNSNDDCTIPSIVRNHRIAYVADGNSPDPDDIGATAASIALMRAVGLEDKLVYCAHSCDLDPFKNPGRQSINREQEANRQRILQETCDGTASRWGGFDHLTFYNCRTQENTAINKLKDAINASTTSDRLAIILAGEPDVIYDAVKAANSNKRKFVSIISHHVANEESADTPGKNISDLKVDFPSVEVTRIPDQNEKLQTTFATWNWARDHQDTRINWLWEQGKIAEEDPVVGFQSGKFDISDAGMLYYQLFDKDKPTVNDFREILECFVKENAASSNNPPTVSITSPQDEAVFEIGTTIPIKVSANDPDGNLDKVNFKINDKFYKTDNTRPFENSFTPTEAGNYKISARAIDKDGLSKEVFISITVNNPAPENRAPEVNITSPQDGAVFTIGEEIVLKAGATDPDSNLDKVNFKINNNFYSTASTRPFENSFTPDAPGTYTIGARAFDKEGLSKEVTVTITVNDPLLSTSNFTQNKLEKTKVKVYPNPAKKVLNIVGLKSILSEIYVIDLSGKIVKHKILSKENAIIEINDLARGIYFLRFNQNDSVKTINFNKQ